VEDHRIDGGPDIVDRGITRQLDRAGLGIDLDLAYMGAVREGRDLEDLVALAGEFTA
jgi:hypothetical protein